MNKGNEGRASGTTQDIEADDRKMDNGESAKPKSNKKKTQVVNISRWLSLLSGLISIFAFVYSISFYSNRFALDRLEKETSPIIDVQNQLKEEIKELKNLKADLDKVKDEILSSTATGSDLEIGKLTASLSDINSRLKKLEDAILESPEKALSVPLLRKEIEAIDSTMGEKFSSTQNEINRVYDMSKWLFGLMITMVVSILGLAVANIFQSKKTIED
jgi:DNA repair exonuclease SbcCD ATPase subunit